MADLKGYILPQHLLNTSVDDAKATLNCQLAKGGNRLVVLSVMNTLEEIKGKPNRSSLRQALVAAGRKALTEMGRA